MKGIASFVAALGESFSFFRSHAENLVPISEEERLDLQEQGINNLTEVDIPLNETSLDLSGNQISDLSPLSKHLALTHLFLNSNQIIDLRTAALYADFYIKYLRGPRPQADVGLCCRVARQTRGAIGFAKVTLIVFASSRGTKGDLTHHDIRNTNDRPDKIGRNIAL
jgi:Leucine-rich repeat (LRR) protein